MLPPLSTRLQTKRLVLRPASSALITPIARALRHNREHLAPWETKREGDHATLPRVTLAVDRERKLWRADAQYGFYVALGDTPTSVIGRVALSGVHRGGHQGAFLGYWIDVDHVGRGFAKEAIGAVLNFAFGPGLLHRVQAAIMPHNLPSVAVARSLGFRQEGHAKGYLQIAGTWEDHLLFAKIREEHATSAGR